VAIFHAEALTAPELDAVGNALAPTAEKSALGAAHAVRGFAALVAEITAFDLGRLEGVA
jgi:hypothetical protein